MTRPTTATSRPSLCSLLSWRTQLCSLLLLIFLLSGAVGAVKAKELQAVTPPRGWNSYDSFSWIISEDEFLNNARILSDKLLASGYEYAVVDFLWYRKRDPGASVSSPGFDVIDEWGRPVPDPARWPSSAGGKGFKHIAHRVHQMGLKFGIHTMRGISSQAVKANTLIMGSQGLPYEENGRVWRARDIALTRNTCGWMPACFMSVNTHLGAGRAFLRSLYHQYADWGVDFVKHDCIFGDDLNVDEISAVSEILKEIDRPILYSISPGTHATPDMAMKINSLVNMYRVTGDDWDSWRDVQGHFDVARDFATSGLIGAQGLLGHSWPDLDMLPLGWLTDPGVNRGPHRSCGLTLEEQKSQMTLWAMAKSPLMFGGDLRHIDETTMSFITNPTLLDINAHSTSNKEFPLISFTRGSTHSKAKASSSSFNSNSELILGLSNCEREYAMNWVIETSDGKTSQACWNGTMATKYGSQTCFGWTTQPNVLLDQKISSDEARNLGQDDKNNQGQSRVLSSIIEDVCLDSSPNGAYTFGQVKSNHFAPCNQHASQNWELTSNGALLNNYSGLCASVTKLEATNKVDAARAWIAKGPPGKSYIAFFNLGPNTLTISTRVEDVFSMLLTKGVKINNKREDNGHQFENKCSCSEVWSGQDLGVISDIIAVDVLGHGCALLILRCT